MTMLRTATLAPALVALLSCSACRDQGSSSGPEPSRAEGGEGGEGGVVSGQGGGGGPSGAPERTDSWMVRADADGRVELYLDGAQIAEFKAHFWAADWKWVGGNGHAAGVDGDSAKFTIDIPGFLHVDARADRTAENQLTLTYEMEALKDIEDVVGGGIEMRVLLDTARAAGVTGTPEFLPDGAGWRVPQPEGDFTVEFDPPVWSGHAGNDHSRLRGAFFRDSLAKGKHTRTVTITLPEGGRADPPVIVRWGPEDRKRWHREALHWNRIGIDVRPALGKAHHAPAGKLGRVQRKGDQLVFGDGTPARFWGTNVISYALFHGDDATICNQAKRIAGLGFNLVRLHHHDSAWVKPNIFVEGAASTRELNPEGFAKIDKWMSCLIDEGVYVWLDLHTGRGFRAGDGIDGYEELAGQGEHEGKGFNYVNPRIAELMREFERKFLQHKNPHTGRRYVDEPGVLGVLITNENDITQHFGHLLNAGDHPVHRKMLEQSTEAFRDEHGLPDESLEAWRPGPAKILYNELEHRFFAGSIKNLEGIGYDGLVSTTSHWGDNRHWSLPSLTTGSMIDAHAYGGGLRLDTNPHHQATFLHRLVSKQVEGFPFSVTEWNVPIPVVDRYVGPLWVSAISALQGWDAPMHFGYARRENRDQVNADGWNARDDPAQLVVMPAAAMAYRLGHVDVAEKTYRLELGREATYERDTSPYNSAAMRTLAEQSRVVVALPDIPELDWDTPPPATPGAITVDDLGKDFLDSGGQRVVKSDTGQIERNWATGILTVDTPQSQWATGWIGEHTVELSDVTLKMQTKHGAVTFSALDGKPLRDSKKILVAAVARVIAAEGGKMPVYSEPMVGTFSIASSVSEPMELVPQLEGHGDPIPKRAPIAGKRKGDRWEFELPANVPAHWFILRPAAAG